MYCPHCRMVLKDGATRCGGCGAPVGEATIAVAAASSDERAGFTRENTSVSSSGSTVRDLLVKHVRRTSHNLIIAAATVCALGLALYLNDRQEGLATGFILIVFAAWLAWKGAARLRNPESHPTFRRLDDFDASCRVTLTRDDEDDTATTWAGSPSSLSLSPSRVITKSWIVDSGVFSLTAIPIAEILWAYRRVTSTKMYGIITTNKENSLVIHTSLGKPAEFKSSAYPQREHEYVLAQIALRSPRTVLGYSKDLSRLWNQDRKAFRRHVKGD